MKRYFLALMVVVCTLSYGFRVNLVKQKEPKKIHIPQQEKIFGLEEYFHTTSPNTVPPIVKGQQEMAPPSDFDLILLDTNKAEMDEIETIKKLLRKVKIVQLNSRETLN